MNTACIRIYVLHNLIVSRLFLKNMHDTFQISMHLLLRTSRGCVVNQVCSTLKHTQGQLDELPDACDTEFQAVVQTHSGLQAIAKNFKALQV